MVIVFFVIAIVIPLLAWRGFAIQGAYTATMIIAAFMWIVSWNSAAIFKLNTRKMKTLPPTR